MTLRPVSQTLCTKDHKCILQIPNDKRPFSDRRTPARSIPRDCLHDVREEATSNQTPLDQTLACPHRHLEKKIFLGVISGLFLAAGTPALGRLLLTLLGRLAASALGCRLLGGLAAGTPALRGGLLGATLLGCHADKFLQTNRTNSKQENKMPHKK